MDFGPRLLDGLGTCILDGECLKASRRELQYSFRKSRDELVRLFLLRVDALYCQLDMLSRGFLLLLLFLFCISVRQFNATIDDQIGDPTNGNHTMHSPQGACNVGQNCTVCAAKVSPECDAYLGTWMDTTYNPSGTNVNNDPGQVVEASVNFVGAHCVLSSP